MTARKLRIVALIAFVTILAAAALSLADDAEAVEEHIGNEDATTAIWLEPPFSIDGAHIWESSSEDQDDWWKFNASGGQHIEVKFRKYTPWNPSPPYSESTYNINFEILNVALQPVIEYHYTWRQGGGDIYQRYTASYVVPSNLGGKYYAHIWAMMSQGHRRGGHYFMNVTVEDIPSLNVQPTANGVMEMNDDYDVDFNWEDFYKIDLTADQSQGDMVTVTMNRGAAAADVYVEAYELVPIGQSARMFDYMVNRSHAGVINQLSFKFTAGHTGTYYIRVFRDFYDEGEAPCTYDLAVLVQKGPLEGDEVPEDGMDILHAQIVRGETSSMGHDTHDWYAVHMVEGDQKFKVELDLLDQDIEGKAVMLVVYNEDNVVMWAQSSVVGSGQSADYREHVELPPAGTVTIFDKDVIWHVRVSAHAEGTADNVNGFNVPYELNFDISNRAPVLIEPFEDSYTWEEDGGISIELDSHFSDVDGDALKYTVFNKTGAWSYDVNGLTYWGYLNVTSPPDFFGEVWWRLKCIDEGQTNPSHITWVDLHFIVTSVSDRPFSNGSITVSCPEEGMATADLHKLFYDVDEGEAGVLHFKLNATDENVSVDLDEDTGAVELTPGPDVFGEYTIQFYTYDDVMEPVYGDVVLNVEPTNDIPRIKMPIPVIRMVENDDDREIDLDEYFLDVDGDPLKYEFQVPSEYSGDMNVYHKGQDTSESHIIIALIDDFFYGTVVINITCKDPDKTVVFQDMVIEISNVPNKAVVTALPANTNLEINEGGKVDFDVQVNDPDVLEFGLHTYTWYFDDVEISDLNESSYSYQTDYDSQGSHTIRVEVTDPAGLMGEPTPSWTVLVKNVNREPSVGINAPATTVIKEGEEITLVASHEDPDGTDLTITWYLIKTDGDEVIGSGETFTGTLPPGVQVIEVEVDDGEVKKTDRVKITVEELEDEGGISTMLLIVIVIVVVVVIAGAAFAMRGRGGGGGPKIVMEGLEDEEEASKLSDEYDPTPGASEGYERLK